MKSAFVAGATGYTGRAVVAELRALGLDTVAHIRPDSPKRAHWTAEFEKLGATVLVCPWQPEALQQHFEQQPCERVFSLLGTTKARMRAAKRSGLDPESQSYQAVDTNLTLMLHSAVQRCCPEALFVFLSSAGVREDSGLAYLEARWQVEQALAQGSLPWLVARPCFITGPGRDQRRALEHYGALLSDGLLNVVGMFGQTGQSLKQKYRSTDNARLAKALVQWAQRDDAAGRIVESDELQAVTE